MERDYYVCEEPGAGIYARSRAEWLNAGAPIPLWSGPADSRSDALARYRAGQPARPLALV